MQFLMTLLIIFEAFLLIKCQSSDLEEDDACTHSDGSPGICRERDRCESIKTRLKNHQLKYVDIVNCGFSQSGPIICCPPPLQTPIVTYTRKQEKQRKRNHEIFCDEISKYNNLSQATDHIIGGENADPGEFPHSVAIGYQTKFSRDPITYRCGGSLISSRFVLSAAHCFALRDFVAVTVKLGRTSLVEDGNDPCPSVDVKIKSIFNHEDYKVSQKYNDIALVELLEDVPYTPHLKPACIFSNETKITTNKSLEITGWGFNSSEKNDQANWLQKAKVYEVPLADCGQYFDHLIYSLPQGLLNSQMCARGRNAKGESVDSCQGDSGGPLHEMTYMNSNEIFYVKGVVSFGIVCGHNSSPGVYTRVSEFVDWIENIVWP